MARDENNADAHRDDGGLENDVAGTDESASARETPDRRARGIADSAEPGRARETGAGKEPSPDHAGRKHSKKTRKEAHEEREKRIADLTAQNEALRDEARELKDKWLRNAAEFENYRKRTRREWELLQQRTKAEVILELLAVVDDFERAFSVVGERDDDFIQGIRLIYNNLQSSLEKLGVRKIEALHAPFDPAYHMAVAQIERDGADSNHVIEIVQQGYCLGDLVIRPAKVVIAK
jgi:molecular chaperone GrpE